MIHGVINDTDMHQPQSDVQ